MLNAMHLLISNRPNGKLFAVSPQNVHIPLPKLGNIVTFTYSSYARREVPADPDIVRLRSDVSWEEIKRNYESELKYLNGMIFFFLFISSFVLIVYFRKLANGWVRCPSRWTLDSEEYESVPGKLCKEQKHGPPATRDMVQHHARIDHASEGISFPQFCCHDVTNIFTISFLLQGGRAVFYKLKGGYFQALTKLFPEVSFDESKFPSVPRMCMLHPSIHPFIHPFIYFIFDFDYDYDYDYDYDLIICLDWDNIENRRKFFEQYAQENAFDPLSAEHWYAQPRSKIAAVKVSSSNYKVKIIRNIQKK